jgi:hypothetical protein
MQVEHVKSKPIRRNVRHDARRSEQSEIQPFAVIRNMHARCRVVRQTEQDIQWDAVGFAGGLDHWARRRTVAHRR